MWKLVLAVLLAGVINCGHSAPLEDIKVTAIELESDPVIENVGSHDVTLIGDVIVDTHRNGVMNNKRWPNGQIPYVINSSYSAEVHDKIVAAMREIEHDVNQPTGTPCIKFLPRTTQANYIDIHQGTGCNSIIGMSNKGKQSVSLGKGCESKGIMMHELIHTIGFWHEQSRSDRDKYISINLSNVPNEEHHDFNLLSSSSSNNLNVPYDFGSIMHYGPYEFSIDNSIPVITPKAGQGSGSKMGQRIALSHSDVTKIQRLYGCTEDTTHITTPLLSANVMTSCSFESNLCSLQSDKTGDFEWERKSGVSTAGPKAGNTNGADPYLIATAAGHHGVARVISPTYNKGSVCIDFFVYQPGTSYLTLVVSGPRVARQTVSTYHNVVYKSWHHSHINLSMSQDTVFQVTFEAHIASGDVAIDDVNIYHGNCV